MNELTQISQELMAIANDALLYCKDKFDAERFREVRKIAARILECSAENITADDALKLFEENDGYHGKWALPGGWCEYDRTIMENTVKEAREEAGIEVDPVRLVAAHSNRKHNNPNSYFYIIRFFVLCKYKAGEFRANEETTDARYFPVDELPSDINDHKSSPEQIRLCLEALRAQEWVPAVD